MQPDRQIWALGQHLNHGKRYKQLVTTVLWMVSSCCKLRPSRSPLQSQPMFAALSFPLNLGLAAVALAAARANSTTTTTTIKG